jgi:hypothetical protein
MLERGMMLGNGTDGSVGLTRSSSYQRNAGQQMQVLEAIKIE